jgi:hypothetical protein
MDQRQSVAVAIALQTLVRYDTPYVRDFPKSTHELTELLRETIAAAPVERPQCAAPVVERLT